MVTTTLEEYDAWLLTIANDVPPETELRPLLEIPSRDSRFLTGWLLSLPPGSWTLAQRQWVRTAVTKELAEDAAATIPAPLPEEVAV